MLRRLPFSSSVLTFPRQHTIVSMNKMQSLSLLSSSFSPSFSPTPSSTPAVRSFSSSTKFQLAKKHSKTTNKAKTDDNDDEILDVDEADNDETTTSLSSSPATSPPPTIDHYSDHHDQSTTSSFEYQQRRTAPLRMEAILKAFEEEYPNLDVDNEENAPFIQDKLNAYDQELERTRGGGGGSGRSMRSNTTSKNNEEEDDDDDDGAFSYDDDQDDDEASAQDLANSIITNPFLSRIQMNPRECTIHGDRVIAIPFRPRSVSDLEIAAEVAARVLVVGKSLSEDLFIKETASADDNSNNDEFDLSGQQQLSKTNSKSPIRKIFIGRPKYLFDFEIVHDLGAPSGTLLGPYLVAVEMSRNSSRSKLLRLDSSSSSSSSSVTTKKNVGRNVVNEISVKAVIRNSTTGDREATGLLTYHF